MKESIDNNEQFYNLSEYNIINSNNNLILPFESHSSKENKIFEDNPKNIIF